MNLGLAFGQDRPMFTSSDTDIEYFRSEISSEKETYVVSILLNVPFNP